MMLVLSRDLRQNQLRLTFHGKGLLQQIAVLLFVGFVEGRTVSP